MTDHRRCTAQTVPGELRHLHQGAVARAHVVAEDVVDPAALFGTGLHVHVAHLPGLIGQSRVLAARQGGDGGHRLLIVDIERLHQLAVDREAESRRTGNELGVKGGEVATAAALADQRLRQLIELVEAVGPVAVIVELEIEAPLGREAGNGRGLPHLGESLTERRQSGVEALGDRKRAVGGTLAFLQRFQADQDRALVRTGAIESVAADDRGFAHVGLLLDDRRDRFGHGFTRAQRGPVLELIDPGQIALVLLGDETGGHAGEGECGDHQAGSEAHHHPPTGLDQGLHQTGVPRLQPGEDSVETVEDQRQVGAGQGADHHAEHVGPAAEGCGAEAAEGQAHDHAGRDPDRAAGFLGRGAAQQQAREHRGERQGVER